MTLVTCDMSMSLDGYVTGPNDSRQNPFGDGAESLHDWLSNSPTDEDTAVNSACRIVEVALLLGRPALVFRGVQTDLYPVP